MGIDLLDITFRMERTFGVRLSLDDLLQAAGYESVAELAASPEPFDITVGQIYEQLLGRLRTVETVVPRRKQMLDRVRAALARECAVPAKMIEGSTMLEELIAHGDRAASWMRLQARLGRRLPALLLPPTLRTAVTIIWHVIGAIVGLLAAPTADPLLNAVVSVAVFALFAGAAWLCSRTLFPWRRTWIPEQCATVDALIEHALGETPLPVSSRRNAACDSEPDCWTRADVWDALQTILSECLGVDRDDIRPASRLVADLGAS
jgi:acyl carrier protein